SPDARDHARGDCGGAEAGQPSGARGGVPRRAGDHGEDSGLFTLLSATGARPEAWAICERLMARQDYAGPVRWVIVDDGPEPQPVTFQRDGWVLEVVRPEPYWQPGQNTQARNLAAGL